MFIGVQFESYLGPTYTAKEEIDGEAVTVEYLRSNTPFSLTVLASEDAAKRWFNRESSVNKSLRTYVIDLTDVVDSYEEARELIEEGAHATEESDEYDESRWTDLWNTGDPEFDELADLILLDSATPTSVE